MKKSVAIASVLAVAAGASANILQSESGGFGFMLSPGQQIVNFNGFDTQGGTRVLKYVEIEVFGTIGANVTAENDSNIAISDFGVNLTGLVDVDGPGGLDASLGIVQSAGPQSVGATDGVAGSGPDFHDFGPVFGNDTDTAIVIAGLAAYTVPFSVTVDGSGGFATTGTSDSTLRISNFQTEGSIEVRYYYDIIPTPGTAGLIGLAGLAGLRRRRA
jgi:hypothetical protein